MIDLLNPVSLSCKTNHMKLVVSFSLWQWPKTANRQLTCMTLQVGWRFVYHDTFNGTGIRTEPYRPNDRISS
jgi:hypothetical protein